MKIEKGTTGFGILLGFILAGLGALVMLIGFWKTLVLALLFAVGFFFGSVENKSAFLKDTANRIIPAKETKPIDIKQEIAKEQEQYAGTIQKENEE